MITLPGVLHIRIITGRNGAFRVGRLDTDIGDFAVKDAELEQYGEGRYEGIFGISQIYPSSYLANGRFIVEVRAKLSLITLASEDEPETFDAYEAEPDPLNEEPVLTTQQTVPEAKTKTSVVTLPTEADIRDEELFGTLWPLSNPVKLDTTVNRQLLRQQTARLGALGYMFQAIGQQWFKN